MQDIRFQFSAFQRNAQPSPQVMISGVWGYVTNKHLAEIPGTGFLLNTQSYGRLHCLPVVLRVFGRESVYSCRIDKPLITAYNRVIILNCYNREMQKIKFFVRCNILRTFACYTIRKKQWRTLHQDHLRHGLSMDRGRVKMKFKNLSVKWLFG